jgi:formylmethanofuran dehydrogenase subunit E
MFGFDDFMDDFVEMESVMPGMVLGTVDVICDGCGEVETHNVNPDGSNQYWCSKCETVTEV